MTDEMGGGRGTEVVDVVMLWREVVVREWEVGLVGSLGFLLDEVPFLYSEEVWKMWSFLSYL